MPVCGTLTTLYQTLGVLLYHATLRNTFGQCGGIQTIFLGSLVEKKNANDWALKTEELLHGVTPGSHIVVCWLTRSR